MLCRLLGHTWTDHGNPGETWRVCSRCDELAWRCTPAPPKPDYWWGRCPTCGQLEDGHDPSQAIAVMDAHRCQPEP